MSEGRTLLSDHNVRDDSTVLLSSSIPLHESLTHHHHHRAEEDPDEVGLARSRNTSDSHIIYQQQKHDLYEQSETSKTMWSLCRICAFMLVLGIGLATVLLLLTQVFSEQKNIFATPREIATIASVQIASDQAPQTAAAVNVSELILVKEVAIHALEKQLESQQQTIAARDSEIALLNEKIKAQPPPAAATPSTPSPSSPVSSSELAEAPTSPDVDPAIIAQTGPSKPATFEPNPTVRPFPLADPASVKSAVVSFVSHNSLRQLAFIYPSVDEHFLHPFNLTWILFWERYPVNMRADLQAFVTTSLKWTAGADESNGQEYFVTPLGTKILSVPLALNLPRFIEKNASYLDDKQWLRCHGGRWPFEYVLYTTTSIHAIMRHRILDHYDYFMKIDTDISFKAPVPFNPFEDLAKRECIFGHSAWETDTQDCHERGYDAMMAYANLNHLEPLSAKYPWCQSSNYFYSNFIFGHLGFLRSQANRMMEEWMYEVWMDGYFKRRWTDQAVWSKMLCMWYDIPDMKNDPKICDYSSWRNKIFKHKS